MNEINIYIPLLNRSSSSSVFVVMQMPKLDDSNINWLEYIGVVIFYFGGWNGKQIDRSHFRIEILNAFYDGITHEIFFLMLNSGNVTTQRHNHWLNLTKLLKLTSHFIYTFMTEKKNDFYVKSIDFHFIQKQNSDDWTPNQVSVCFFWSRAKQ